MRILIIGATGTIGKAVSDRLSAKYEVIRVGYKDGDMQVDIGDKDSIKQLLEKVGKVDAIVSTAGLANFGPLDELTDADFQLAIGNKLMGQVNLVRLGAKYLNPNGSITLTSGLLAYQPMPGSSAISMVNAGLEGFVRAAALELKNGHRINAVSPVFIKETMEMMGMDSSQGMPASEAALAYEATIEGNDTGKTLNVLDYV